MRYKLSVLRGDKMKKKIGILTFHQCINYGAILQTFALQKYLNRFDNVNAEVINYENKTFKEKYTIRRFFKKQKISYFIYNYLVMPFWFIKKHRFNKFTKKNIKISKLCKNSSQIKDYDLYVVGSDQVWNLSTTNYDYTYFLDFVCDNKKKSSYAASFGVDKLPAVATEKVKKLLSSFNSISVRENQGKSIVSTLVKNNVDVVLDPTLLLNKDEWLKYASNCNKSNEKYVLIYQLAYSKSLVNFAKKIANKKGYRIVTIDGNPRQFIRAKYVLSAGPSEWLKLFFNAECIVTNSFHGLVFSLNLNKNFFFEYLKNGITVNSRLKNVAEIFKIEDRLIDNNLNNTEYNNPDFEKINKILDFERAKSYKWIENNILK